MEYSPRQGVMLHHCISGCLGWHKPSTLPDIQEHISAYLAPKLCKFRKNNLARAVHRGVIELQRITQYANCRSRGPAPDQRPFETLRGPRNPPHPHIEYYRLALSLHISTCNPRTPQEHSGADNWCTMTTFVNASHSDGICMKYVEDCDCKKGLTWQTELYVGSINH